MLLVLIVVQYEAAPGHCSGTNADVFFSFPARFIVCKLFSIEHKAEKWHNTIIIHYDDIYTAD